MSTTTRKSNKKTTNSYVKPLGVTRNSRSLSIDGEPKLLTNNVAPSVVENLPVKSSAKLSIIDNSTSRNIVPTRKDSDLADHISCNQLILQLKEDMRLLTNENGDLKMKMKSIAEELSTLKQEKNKADTLNISLTNSNETLSSSNVLLKGDIVNLGEEIRKITEEWRREKEILETSLNSIKKEFETKIIDIRAKHSDEILNLEEKNRLLKVRLADNMKVNSWERQQEIDRISSDLEKSLANEGNLKMQLNKVMSQKKGDSLYCLNCRAQISSPGVNQSKKSNSERS